MDAYSVAPRRRQPTLSEVVALYTSPRVRSRARRPEMMQINRSVKYHCEVSEKNYELILWALQRVSQDYKHTEAEGEMAAKAVILHGEMLRSK